MNSLIIHGFDNIYWLIVGAGVLAGILYYLFTKKTQENFIDEDILKEVYAKNSMWHSVYIFLTVCITSLFFITLASPYNEKEVETMSREGIDIEIVFDLSSSMTAKDILPSRVDAAKQVFVDFLSEIHSDRVGLVLFAGKAFQSVPLSYDYDFLSQIITDMSIETIDTQNPSLQGTAIGDALVLASDILLSGDEQREKIIILITDGTANTGVDPEIAMKLLSSENIKTYTIGVGQIGATFIDVTVGAGFTQRVEIAGVDEEILKQIATQTGGKYFRADSADTLSQILDTIGELEKTELETQSISYHASRKEIPVSLLLLSFFGMFYIVFSKKIEL